MLDDLRNSSAFIDDDEAPNQEQAQQNAYMRPARARRKKTFLGMTAQQRFIVSLMLFMMVCLLGVFALVLSGSVAMPF